MGRKLEEVNACFFTNFQDRMKGSKMRAGLLEEERIKVQEIVNNPRNLICFARKEDFMLPAALMLVVFRASSHTKPNWWGNGRQICRLPVKQVLAKQNGGVYRVMVEVSLVT